jgi:hypothetical protein
MAKITNINDGGTVGIQCGDSDDDNTNDGVEITNINNGGFVGIQGANVSGCTVIVSWGGDNR